MTRLLGVVALDGHDGSGKTTLGRWLASSTGGSYQRPFQGAAGVELLSAANRGDSARVIAIGSDAIATAITAAREVRPLILDRGWMTVASLVEWALFSEVWQLWVPTALCWADLETTMARLSQRFEEQEATQKHEYYLDVYRGLAERTGSYIVRSDLYTEQRCREVLLAWLEANPSPPMHTP